MINKSTVSQSNVQQQAQERQLVDSGTDPIRNFEDQEQRDYEIALRLAHDSDSSPIHNQLILGNHLKEISAVSPTGQQQQQKKLPIPPSQNHADSNMSRYDLTKWKYSDLRDTINTSCDLELLEACKREFHRRLKVYHAWRAMNSRRAQGAEELRAPSSVMEQSNNGKSSPGSDQFDSSGNVKNGRSVGLANEQRYFRIPFVKTSSNSGQRGWWFAHFDGQWIARQLELHPDKEPILLIAGQHDIEMCELSLRETRLTSKRGAEILPQEFEEEWAKHGGKSYMRGSTSTLHHQQHQPMRQHQTHISFNQGISRAVP